MTENFPRTLPTTQEDPLKQNTLAVCPLPVKKEHPCPLPLELAICQRVGL